MRSQPVKYLEHCDRETLIAIIDYFVTDVKRTDYCPLDSKQCGVVGLNNEDHLSSIIYQHMSDEEKERMP